MMFIGQIEDHFGGIRTLSEGRGSQLLVGTTRNCILVGDVEMDFHPVMLGHTEEVWGLAAHPTLPQFATGGHDRLLQMWDSLSHTVVWSKDIGVRRVYSSDSEKQQKHVRINDQHVRRVSKDFNRI